MEVIRDIVTTIVIILVLAAILEMILPNSNMQRFVKVILGLFIIITLLNPLLGIINKDFSEELTSWQVMDKEKELESILASGNAISSDSREKALSQYEDRLGKQVLSLIRLNNDSLVREAKVTVSREENNGHLGQIKEVFLFIGEEDSASGLQAKGVVEPVDPVKVQIGNVEKDSQKDSAKEVFINQKGLENIVDAITNFYGLNKDQIKVIKE